MTLELAVPMWVEKIKSYNLPLEAFEARRLKCSQHIAEHGDNIMFRSKKKGDTARAFNRLAEALAICSFAPGGVTFAGMKWEYKLCDTE